CWCAEGESRCVLGIQAKCMHSLYKHLIQLIEYRWELLPKESICFDPTSPLVERDLFKVIYVYCSTVGNVLLDHLQPLQLLRRELSTLLSLHLYPMFKCPID